MDALPLLVAATLNAGTPLLLAALGIVVVERSGVVNLGIEGMMLVAAIVAFAATHATRSYALGFAAGAVAAASLAAVFAFFAIGLHTNQYATGLAFALAGAGLSAFIGLPYSGQSLPARAADGIPGLREWPVLGTVLFSHHAVVYLSWALVAAVAWFLYRTRWGLVLRAVGESPEAAHALGYPVRAIRVAALAFGGACAGLAGAYLSIVYTPLWAEGMVAGRGWIALALVVFSSWLPWRLAAGAYLFGAISVLAYTVQTFAWGIPSQWLSALPYLVTVVALVVIWGNRQLTRANTPACLGQAFVPDR